MEDDSLSLGLMVSYGFLDGHFPLNHATTLILEEWSRTETGGKMVEHKEFYLKDLPTTKQPHGP